MSFDKDRLPKSLVDAYCAKRCAIFVGAGISQGAGLPGWDDFLELLIQRCIDESLLSAEGAEEYRELVGAPGKQLKLASALKDTLGSAWDAVITEIFYEGGQAPTEVHDLLPQLDKLTLAITTNYDTLIETAYTTALGRRPRVLTFKDSGEMRRLTLQREFFVLKAHGDAEKPGNGIILTVGDYRELARERAYQSLLASIFTLNTVFFIGVSLDDPELLVLLDYLADTFEPTARPTHYALIPEDEINAVERDRWRKDYLIQIIPIKKDNNFEEIPQSLHALRELAEASDAGTSGK